MAHLCICPPLCLMWSCDICTTRWQYILKLEDEGFLQFQGNSSKWNTNLGGGVASFSAAGVRFSRQHWRWRGWTDTHAMTSVSFRFSIQWLDLAHVQVCFFAGCQRDYPPFPASDWLTLTVLPQLILLLILQHWPHELYSSHSDMLWNRKLPPRVCWCPRIRTEIDRCGFSDSSKLV